jgi:hypothetical protein
MYKYEHELKVPYYLLFVPEEQELTLYQHTGEKYVSVKPNEHGRYPIPKLELELGLLEGWVRFWFRGKLLPLPAELQQELNEVRQRLTQTEQRLTQAEQRLTQTEQRLTQTEQRLTQTEQQRTQAEQEITRLQALLRQHGIKEPSGPGQEQTSE